ncbi:MAG TPA: hypothetical protein VK837_03010 [Longimicrobiales bacterium]|nr:hypothetical protein [Longimicrobiales bacterium]
MERAGERWTVFLVTYPTDDGAWRGYLSFRPSSGTSTEPEVRTADLWIEETEPALANRARGLGRPLILSLLGSAIEVHDRRQGYSADLRQWFRGLLGKHASTLVPDIGSPADDGVTIPHLRSLYESYRIDQMAHLISLIPADHFDTLVTRVLDGRKVDFSSRDRLQIALLVVQELERYLPLPPFEIWSEDYLLHRDVYHAYAHELHREGKLG